MKIAVPSRQNRVDEHFGHCEYFTVFTVNENNRRLIGLTVDIHFIKYQCMCQSIPEKSILIIRDTGITQIDIFKCIQRPFRKNLIIYFILPITLPGINSK